MPPTSTQDLAWWVMTGAIAALLSLITLMVAIIGYLLKTGFDRLTGKIDALQSDETKTAKDVSAHIAQCEERHKRLDYEIATMKGPHL